MTSIDELLSQRRRGALSDADERRLQMAVQTSSEHRLTLLAGEAFDRAGVPQSDDAALIKHIVRQVGGEWSGTFQRVAARRRLSRWISVPVLIAGVAAASFGGYRAISSPAAPSQAVSFPALPTPALPTPALPADGALTSNAPARTAPETPAPIQPAARSPLAAVPEAAPAALPSARSDEPPAPIVEGAPAQPPPPPPAAPSSVAAAPIRATAAVPAAAARAPGAGWRLPKPKPRAAQRTGLDTEVAAVLPLPSAAVAGSAGGPAAPQREPDLESASALFRRANELRQNDWAAAAALYERLALRHTESREAGVAEMALGKHALAEGRALSAVQWFEAYQRRAGGELAAEAIWGEARALQSLGETVRARELWTRLIERYPASAYAAAAREQLGP
ncbi:MAG TPA: tetratricopeptide repeat protein [Polyangiaceae bacterium]|nr:tetratricopeptide repeat protein [Polyangiaceae bacterium]